MMIPEYDKPLDDGILAVIERGLLVDMERGVPDAPSEHFLYRVSWLCRTCTEVHLVRGNTAQIQRAVTAFLLWHFPYIVVMPESFCVLMESEGRNLHDYDGLKATAADYVEYLARTNG